jgi:hypothetical protein
VCVPPGEPIRCVADQGILVANTKALAGVVPICEGLSSARVTLGDVQT